MPILFAEPTIDIFKCYKNIINNHVVIYNLQKQLVFLIDFLYLLFSVGNCYFPLKYLSLMFIFMLLGLREEIIRYAI